jgi:serine protease Do
VLLLVSSAQAQTFCDPGNWHVTEVAQVLPRAAVENSGFLGVRLVDVDAEHAKMLKLDHERGAEVKAVMEGSPADKAGIEPGDVLLTYNGETILSAQQLTRMVMGTAPGRSVKVQYWRNGKMQMTLAVIGTASTTPVNPFSATQMPMSGWQMPGLDFPSPMLVWRNPLLGLEYEFIDSQLAEYFGVKGGVLVRLVQTGSPADRAGLKAGDVIYSVAQQSLATAREFSSLLRRGSGVTVSVMRDHKHLDLTLNVP